jgi:predicted N-acetyltransferase YhbS
VTLEFGLEAPGERRAVEDLLRSNGWETDRLDEGEVWVARDRDEVIGVVHGSTVGPGAFYVEAALVRDGRRGSGVGAELVRRVQDAHPGELYLACHDNRVAFYERLGYRLSQEDALPPAVRDFAYVTKDLPGRPEHVHHMMRREG